MAHAIVAALSLGNTVDVTTGDLRKGTAFDNIKATFGQALKIGNHPTNLACEYDHSANKDFLKEVSLSGDLMSASKDSDVSVSYEVTHDFVGKATKVRASPATGRTQGEGRG